MAAPGQTNTFLDVHNKHAARIKLRLARIAFTGSTLRMFEKGSAHVLRGYVLNKIGDAPWLREVQNPEDFDARFYAIVSDFPPTVRMNSNCNQEKPGFGQKAKIVSLYFKALLTEREPLDNETADRVGYWFHVPLDSIVLDNVTEQFDRDLSRLGLKGDNLKLARLSETDYRIIQGLLREKARVANVPPIWFDDLWADRE